MMCTKCFWEGEQEELESYMEDNGTTLVEKEGCPNCKTDEDLQYC